MSDDRERWGAKLDEIFSALTPGPYDDIDAFRYDMRVFESHVERWRDRATRSFLHSCDEKFVQHFPNTLLSRMRKAILKDRPGDHSAD